LFRVDFRLKYILIGWNDSWIPKPVYFIPTPMNIHHHWNLIIILFFPLVL
jgi:hypothetical protein